MFFRILKNDLRHKPVTNIILFLFIMLSVTFAAAGVNNIVTVLTAQSDYYEAAGIKDYYVISGLGQNITEIEKSADKFRSISSYSSEPMLMILKTGIKSKNIDEAAFGNPIMVCPAAKSATTYFGRNDSPLTAPRKGEIWVPQKFLDTGCMSEGQSITVTLGDTSLDFIITETVKDALFGADGMGMFRLLISEEDFDELDADPVAGATRLGLFGFDTDDIQALLSELSDTKQSFFVNFSGETLYALNYLNLSVAALLALFSFCLIVVFLVILRYTIRFTLNQEFRDIGVMKAIGLTDRKIGDLYLIKYFALSFVGTVLGFAASIPFGELLLKSLSSAMVIANRDPFGINIVCAAVILMLVLLFCRHCVKMLEQFSPADAVRNGSTGESYGGKHRFTMMRSRLHPDFFLPLNDIYTNIRQYLVMGLSFIICLLLVLVLADTVNTMGSGSVMKLFGMKESDVVLTPDSADAMELVSMDETFSEYATEIERTLKDEGIPGRVFSEFVYSGSLTKGSRHVDLNVMTGHGTTADEYDYISGSAPTEKNEIAITKQVAEALNVTIGDVVRFQIGDEEKNYLVTGLIQSMMNMGMDARTSDYDFFHGKQCIATYGYQILFDNRPSERQLEERINRLAELFPNDRLYTGPDFIESLIGNVTSTLKVVRTILVPILLIICALVTVLMELSFIDREKGETAMMKAIGFKDGFLIRRHLCRTGIIGLVSVLIAEFLSRPVAQITSGVAFRALGATKIRFVVRPMENYLFWPCIILTIVLAAVFFTALQMRCITARDTAGIE